MICMRNRRVHSFSNLDRAHYQVEYMKVPLHLQFLDPCLPPKHQVLKHFHEVKLTFKKRKIIIMNLFLPPMRSSSSISSGTLNFYQEILVSHCLYPSCPSFHLANSKHKNKIKWSIQKGYLAFTSQESPGVLHLKKLSDAGRTHNLEVCRLDMEMLKSLSPDSPEQQEYITAIQNEDGYNWGYNPVLWGVPKGSYSTNANGSCRIIEPRGRVNMPLDSGAREMASILERWDLWESSKGNDS
uniref:Uncharacterized protein n=1 Tax=Lactuca sativa TaxID=4236 RepID=A0A9R1X0H9_LACSA|nr:hypothetical protein LSAT_V11C800410270 [Lactuca sativa]